MNTAFLAGCGAILILLTAPSALAQSAATVAAVSPYGYEIDDEQIYVHGIFNQFEGRLNGQNGYFRWDGDLWAGTDENQVWLKSEGRVYGDGKVEDGDQELLYTRPISRFFDIQGGMRYDLDSLPGRAWAAIGIQGTAPQFVDVSFTLYARGGGNFAAKLEASYDLYLTQFLVLQPQFELNAYSQTDRPRDIGAGLSDIDYGLRLRYEITRKFAPYLGVADYRQLGGSAGLAREAGEHADDLRFLIGIRMWF